VIGRRIVRELPRVPPSRRAELLAQPRERALHAELAAGMPFLDAVEVEPPPRPRALGASARVLAWNAERCKRPDASARWLDALGADVLLLSELDHGMARSGQRHAARELAARLGCGYAFAVEFLELELGGEREREEQRGAENAVGYHGNAILARAPLGRPAVVRLESDGGWFDGARGERRLGGRIAVLAQLDLAGTPVCFAAVHLESHGDPPQRAAQLSALLAAIDAYAPDAPTVIGGDLNSFSLGLADLADPARVAAALRDDPERWAHPDRHEPLFAAARAAGYDWRGCNVDGEPTHRTAAPTGSARGRLKLDWFLCRDLRAHAPRVHAAVESASGGALSDHEAIEVRIALGAS
jgi:endonuclease/exonuclease/phosphatase family metal-dependent hydrolase